MTRLDIYLYIGDTIIFSARATNFFATCKQCVYHVSFYYRGFYCCGLHDARHLSVLQGLPLVVYKTT